MLEPVKMVRAYPRTTAYIAVVVTALLLLDVAERFGWL